MTKSAAMRYLVDPYLVSWTATDASGNTASVVQRVIVRNTNGGVGNTMTDHDNHVTHHPHMSEPTSL